MTDNKGKLYVGCALTHAEEDFRQSVEKFKENLRKADYEVLDFLWVLDDDPTPKQVYEWDIKGCVKNCDVLVGICDHPSLGLGFEIGEAVRMGKRVILIAHNETKVSRLVVGAADVEPNVSFHRYEHLEKDGFRAVCAELEK